MKTMASVFVCFVLCAKACTLRLYTIRIEMTWRNMDAFAGFCNFFFRPPPFPESGAGHLERRGHLHLAILALYC